jgi:hypothetical protein
MGFLTDDLDEVCIGCVGQGENLDGDPCFRCQGYGHVLRDSGLVLITFLERHGFVRGMSPLVESELRGTVE